MPGIMAYPWVKERNYTPKPIKERVYVVNENKKEHLVKQIKEPKPQKNNIPKKGSNRPRLSFDSPYEMMHSWRNTISGTGYGHPYWDYKKNPFEP